MTHAVYAGSFDPITYGHLDVIVCARMLFTKVTVAVGHNARKSTLFTPDECVALINETVAKELGSSHAVTVAKFDGLLVDFCQAHEIGAIVRGLRAVTDFEAEMTVAHANRSMNPGINTVFFPTAPEHSFISSSTVKEIARHPSATAWESLHKYVPPNVLEALKRKFNQ